MSPVPALVADNRGPGPLSEDEQLRLTQFAVTLTHALEKTEEGLGTRRGTTIFLRRPHELAWDAVHALAQLQVVTGALSMPTWRVAPADLLAGPHVFHPKPMNLTRHPRGPERVTALTYNPIGGGLHGVVRVERVRFTISGHTSPLSLALGPGWLAPRTGKQRQVGA